VFVEIQIDSSVPCRTANANASPEGWYLTLRKMDDVSGVTSSGWLPPT
jgi:hypothetical protein